MIFFAFIMGLVFGSFANVLIARMPKNESIIRPRSHCPHCGHTIRFWENVPLLSFVILRGRCSACKKRISYRYPLVELLMGLLFVLPVYRYGWDFYVLLRDWPLAFLLLTLSFIDLDHRIIPDELSLGGAVYGLVSALIFGWDRWISYGVGAVVGFGVFYFFAWAYHRSTGREGLGGGDIKLMAAVGAFVGWQGVFGVVLISSLTGALVGILQGILVRSKGPMLQHSIPYGPFIAFATWIVHSFGDQPWLQSLTLM